MHLVSVLTQTMPSPGGAREMAAACQAQRWPTKPQTSRRVPSDCRPRMAPRSGVAPPPAPSNTISKASLACVSETGQSCAWQVSWLDRSPGYCPGAVARAPLPRLHALQAACASCGPVRGHEPGHASFAHADQPPARWRLQSSGATSLSPGLSLAQVCTMVFGAGQGLWVLGRTSLDRLWHLSRCHAMDCDFA